MAFLQAAANTGSLPTEHQVANSCKFERSSNEAIETTNAAVGNKKTWTFSAWIKRTELGKDYHCLFGAGYTNIHFMDNDRLRAVFYDGSTSYYADTFVVFRDTSAWYHIVVSCDTTDGTRIQAVKMYINGVRVSTDGTGFSNSSFNNMPQNTDTGIGYAGSDGSERYLRLGRFFSGDEGFSGYMAEVHYVNGTARAADQFGEFDDSGIWIPKKYLGGYGTQGFRYEFKTASALGTDSSPEGHNANSYSNIAAADQSTDTPTNNFAVGTILNPSGVFSEGATRWVSPTGSFGADGTWNLASIALTGGNWYCEAKMIATTNTYYQVGINPYHPNDSFASRLMYRSDGNIYNAGSGGNTSGHTTYTAGDIIGMAYNTSANTVIFSKNGTDIVTKTAIARDDPYFFGGVALSSGTWTADYNFGGYANYSISSPQTDANGYGTFEYAPPTGYYALCTKNLAEYG
jgi:hypothetical protein